MSCLTNESHVALGLGVSEMLGRFRREERLGFREVLSRLLRIASQQETTKFCDRCNQASSGIEARHESRAPVGNDARDLGCLVGCLGSRCAATSGLAMFTM